MSYKRKSILVISLLAIIACCSSWGFLVHRTVNQLAIYELPRPMQPFFYRYMNYLVENAVRPDLRRNEDSTEAPKHFIDLEMYGDSAAWKMPTHWDDALKQFPKDSLIKYGYVPYYIITMKNRLTHAFQAALKDSILFYAADLGHYIADANVPLHTSVNYDGQLTNQKGLHGLWESTVPDLDINQYQLRDKHSASYLDNPEESIWNAVRKAHILLNNLFSNEKDAGTGFTDSTKFRVQVRQGRETKSYSPEFAKAYSRRLGNTVNEQLISSSNLIADFWYTAWVDAGKPDLDNLLEKPVDKKEKKALRMEKKYYRRGELIEKNLLIARKAQPSR